MLAGEILGVIRVDVPTLAKDTGIKQKSMLVMELSSMSFSKHGIMFDNSRS